MGDMINFETSHHNIAIGALNMMVTWHVSSWMSMRRAACLRGMS